MLGSDFVSLPKKLAMAWSSSTLTRQLSLSLLDDVHSNWHKQEKKVKMRILLSFLGLDAAKKQELSSALRRLLQLARDEETTEAWVCLTAQLVHERLFGVSMESGNGDTESGFGHRDFVKETTETIIERLVAWSSNESSNDSSYFQPLEFRYLQTSWVSAQLSDSIVNQDFHYTGSAPDFIAREKERQLNDQNSRAPGLMRVKITEPVPLPTSNPSNPVNRGLTSLEAAKKAKAAGGGARVQTKMISLDDIQAKKALESNAAQQEKLTGAKRKAAAVAAAAAATAAAAAAAAAAATVAVAAPVASSSVAPSSSSSPMAVATTEETSATSSANSRAGASKTAISKYSKSTIPESSTEDNPLTSLLAAAVQAHEAHAIHVDTSTQENPNSVQPIDINALFAESPLLSDEDKTIIINFFSASNPYPESTPTRRIKLSETDTDAGKESLYLVLRFTDRTWTRTKKTKSKKIA